MNITIINIIALLTLSTGVTVFASNFSNTPVSLIKSTSLVNLTTCPSASVLYRGISGNFFPIENVLKNMLGDSLAELPSWRLSTIYNSLKNEGTSDSIKWETAKKIAEKEFNLLRNKNAGKICDLANHFADLTMQGNDLKTRSKSLGIAFTPNRSYAAGYIGAKIYNASSASNESAMQNGILVEIKEQIPRAGLASEYGNQQFAEFYVPLFVPKEDISAAWTDSLHIEKQFDSSGNVKVKVFRVKNGAESLKLNWPLDAVLIGEVVQCSDMELCESDDLRNNTELESIKRSLMSLKERGIRFKLTIVKPTSS